MKDDFENMKPLMVTKISLRKAIYHYKMDEKTVYENEAI